MSLAGLFIVSLLIYSGYLLSQINAPSLVKQPTISVSPLTEDISFMNNNGFQKVELHVSPGRVILSKNCTGLVITTTTAKTYEIQRGFDQSFDLRPNAHDLIADMIELLNAEIIAVRIHELRNDIFYANMIIKKDNEVLDLDTKPSDALAIAARFKAPIYVADDIFEKGSNKIC